MTACVTNSADFPGRLVFHVFQLRLIGCDFRKSALAVSADLADPCYARQLTLAD